jgi:SAM-dependent methyltransferase
MSERQYVLGTHDDEIARLGLQHGVWRDRAIDAWRRAGFGAGQTLIDLGCGPGFASVDLAEVVGPSGRVIAVDRSPRFLAHLDAACAARGIAQVTTGEMDLDDAAFDPASADGAWSRWVFSFVRRPRALLERVRDALRPGGKLVLHEYGDYAAWRTAPRVAEVEAFVSEVMASWRAAGGEPDIALDLPRWLSELGFTVASARPIVSMVAPGTPEWGWLKAFLDVGMRRLVELGNVSAQRAAEIDAGWRRCQETRDVWMITPMVIEIVAVRGAS